MQNFQDEILINTEPNFRSYLQNELILRCKKNPNYSLRSFAKFLLVEPSALSKILKDRRNISEKMLKRLCDRLSIGPQRFSEFKKELHVIKTASIKSDYKNLLFDTFKVISEWYHYAILELIQISHFKPDPKWIAKTLGITVSEVNIAVLRLQKLMLLEITEDGKWIDHSGNFTNIKNEFTDVSLRILQRIFLEKASDALENVPIDKRDQSTVTMAISASLLKEAKEKIKEFRRSLADFLQNNGEKNEVYNLVISLYPLTNIENGNNKKNSSNKRAPPN